METLTDKWCIYDAHDKVIIAYGSLTEMNELIDTMAGNLMVINMNDLSVVHQKNITSLLPENYDGTPVLYELYCIHCKEVSDVLLPWEEFHNWKKTGATVQNAFPYMNASERELLISGTHAKCWDELFSTMDE